MTLIADKTHVVTSYSKDDTKCGLYEETALIVAHKKQHFFMFTCEIDDTDVQRTVCALLLDKNGVWWHAEWNQITNKFVHIYPAVRNRLLSATSANSDVNRFRLALTVRAFKHHNWSVVDFYEKMKDCGSSHFNFLYSIESLKQRLIKVSDDDINFIID